ncbi:hypothetical protein D3C80_808650 [compost metagenome]
MAGTQQHQVCEGRAQQHHLQCPVQPALDLQQAQAIEGERHGRQPQQAGGNGALALEAGLGQGQHYPQDKGGAPAPNQPAGHPGFDPQHQGEAGDHPDGEELVGDPRALARAEIPAPQDDPERDQGPQGHQAGQGKEPKRKLDEHRVSGSKQRTGPKGPGNKKRGASIPKPAPIPNACETSSGRGPGRPLARTSA